MAANYIKKIRTTSGDLPIDYDSLANKPEIPTKTSDLENDSNFLTEHQDLSDYAKKADIPTDYAESEHNHSISDVSNLQNTLDAKATQASLNSHTDNTDIHVTTTNKSNWNSAYTHSTSAHAPSNAEKNIIVGIQKNGTDLTVDSSTRKVNITVPTTAAEIGAATSGHNHDSAYDAKGAAASALSSANAYTDTEIGKIVIPDSLSDLTSDSTHRVVTDAQISTWDAKSGFSGSYNDLTNKPTLGSLASKSTVTKSDLESAVQTSLNKADTALQSFTETDPTVPAWAKAASKPSYTASEVGAVPTSRTVNGKALSTNITLSASDVGADASGSANTALESAKSYTNEKIDAIVGEGASTTLDTIGEISAAIEENQDMLDTLNSAIGSKANTTDLTSHTGNKSNPHSVTKAQIGLGNVDNTSDINKPVSTAQQTAINTALNSAKTYTENQINALSKIEISNTTPTDGQVDLWVNSAASGSIDIPEVNDNTVNAEDTWSSAKISSELATKAASSHGAHVTFDSTNKPKMDGTAAFGTATTVSRSDHVHPTDTSRASKTEFDTHVADTTKHITSTERTNWGAAYTHSQAAHAPSNAEKNQNAFSNVTVGSTTIAADSTTDTLTLVAGNNVTITPDATNDKITISATDTVYTHPNSGVTAGTYKSVTVNAQGHVTAGTNPTTLSGYGITDAASKTHTHAASDITSGTLSSDRLPTVPIAKGGTGATTAAAALTNLGLTATAAELNKMDGVTATTAELNYLDGVTSNIQTQLDSLDAASENLASIINELDNKIVNPDWNENDETSSSYIKNRPFYEIPTLETIFEEQTITITGSITSNYQIPIEENQTYIVKWNGTEYTCTSTYAYIGGGSSGNLIGNLSKLNNGGADTGEPFCIGSNDYSYYMAGNVGTATVEVIHVLDSNVKTLDPKYLPDNIETLDTTSKDLVGAINEIVNSGVSVGDTLPIESQVYFDGTEDEIPEGYVKVDAPFSNPNLLINGGFQVWQRGTSFIEQTGTAAQVFCADRWSTFGGIIAEKTENGIKVTGGAELLALNQRLEFKLKSDTTYTLSAKVNGVVYTKTFNGGNYFDESLFVYISWGDEFDTIGIYIPTNTTYEIEWIKLEQGSIATPFVPRGYGEELELCERYYQKYTEMVLTSAPNSSNQMFGGFPLRHKMRTAPSIKYRFIQNQSGSDIGAHTSNHGTTDDSYKALIFNQDVGNHIYLGVDFDAEIY